MRVAGPFLGTVAALLACALALPGRTAGGEAASGALDWTIGSWEGSRRDGGDGSRKPMTLRVEPILGGAGVAEHLEVRHEGGVYRGFSVTVFDREERVWVRQYVNAVRGHFVRLEGAVEEGGRSTWKAAAPDRARQSRLVSVRLGEDRWRRTQLVSEDGGESWQVLWEDELERVPTP